MALHFRRVVFIGAGGVGFWAAVAAADDLQHVDWEIWDGDDFNGGNGFRRLPYPIDRSQKKTAMLRGFCSIAMRTPIYETRDEMFDWTVEQWQGDLTGILFVDATDMDIDRKREMREALESKGGTYLRGSYDGLGVVGVYPGLPLMAAPGGNYAAIPTKGQTFAAAGLLAMAIQYALETGKIIDLEIHVPVNGDKVFVGGADGRI